MSEYLTKFNEWEAVNELSDREKSSIATLSSLCSDAFLSARQPLIAQNQQDKGTERNTENISIETTQQFMSWFADIEEEMERNQDYLYTKHLDTLQNHKNYIQSIIEKIDTAKQVLESLDHNYEFVQKKTKGLQTACESLLDEQSHMVSVTEDISHQLKYFMEFENISKMLNVPGQELVLDPAFPEMLQKLDHCLSFMNEHVCIVNLAVI
jgi:chromosome segregation ATPase